MGMVREPKRTPLIELHRGDHVRAFYWVDSGRDAGLVDVEHWTENNRLSLQATKHITPSQALDALAKALRDGWTTIRPPAASSTPVTSSAPTENR